ncbi:hypothetical protein [Halobacillus faecis]
MVTARTSLGMGTITVMARISRAMDTIMVKGRILLDMGTNMGIAHMRRAMDIIKGMGSIIPGMEGIITLMEDFINPSLKKGTFHREWFLFL